VIDYDVTLEIKASIPLFPFIPSRHAFCLRATNPRTINTSVKSIFNSPIINTYKIARLKVTQNQHLQKKGAGVHKDVAGVQKRASVSRLYYSLPGAREPRLNP